MIFLTGSSVPDLFLNSNMQVQESVCMIVAGCVNAHLSCYVMCGQMRIFELERVCVSALVKQ